MQGFRDLSEVIRARVADAKAQGGIIKTHVLAAELLAENPDCGFSIAQITDAIIRLASGSGVALEIGESESP